MKIACGVAFVALLPLLASCLEVTDKKWYPEYHLAPPGGWMNDPNGLIYYDGYYHAFYQYNPNNASWGTIHWGHARSKDMLNWEHLPIALEPSLPEDKDGVFSGSAVEDSDGKMVLIFTGHSIGNDDQARQVQLIARSEDGINFKDKHKILEPPEPTLYDFRDPKVWKHNDTWYMVVGTKVDGHAEVLLYKSNDLESWEMESHLLTGNRTLGYMWECPDFFPLGDKYVLMVSPQGIEASGYDFRNLYQTGYFIGTWNPGEPFHPLTNFTEVDHGQDFYAAQSFLAPDGRRIQIGWLDMWEQPYPEDQDNWTGMLSLPREISLDEDGLRPRVKPVREVEGMRRKCRSLEDVGKVVNEKRLLEEDVTVAEVDLKWDLEGSDAESFGLQLGTDVEDESGVFLYVDRQSGRLMLDRRYPEYGLVGYRSVPVYMESSELSLRVFFDRSSIEVFVNDGEAVLSSRIYPKGDERNLHVYAWGGNGVLKSGHVHLLGHK